MRKTNKLLAVVMAALLCLCLGAVPVMADGELYVANGDLNAVTGQRPTAWYKDEGVSYAQNPTAESETDKALCFDTTGGGTALLSVQTSADAGGSGITGLENGKMYTLSMQVYVEAAPETGSSNLTLYAFPEVDASGEPRYDRVAASKAMADGKWHTLVHSFICLDNTEKGIRVTLDGTAGYKVYIDNFAVKEETNVLQFSGSKYSETGEHTYVNAQGSNTINTGFELGTSAPQGFTVYSAFDLSAVTDCVEGQYALQITQNEASAGTRNGILKSLTSSVFEIGAWYKFSCAMKSGTSNDVKVEFRFTVPNVPNYLTANASWSRKSFYFQVPETLTNASWPFYINLYDGSKNLAAGSSVILDDLRLEKVANENVFVNSAGFSVTEAAAGETVTARVTRVPAVAGTAESALYAVATYKRNEDGSVVVTDVKCEKVEITASDSYVTKEIFVTMPTPEDTETYTIKSFVWDGALMPADALCTVTLATE